MQDREEEILSIEDPKRVVGWSPQMGLLEFPSYGYGILRCGDRSISLGNHVLVLGQDLCVQELGDSPGGLDDLTGQTLVKAEHLSLFPRERTGTEV
ncbi:hypothetical protein BELL_0335g00030 [Botrytis elliptica]|uniref:Uncharacterized protein n=1 Tax=Botrytis elliptica TaxID=278938 RepID=A0A4Z1JJI5_9HELO|nr:hypothetical protein BELL_0335g00030 [Botrytis elliptica]